MALNFLYKQLRDFLLLTQNRSEIPDNVFALQSNLHPPQAQTTSIYTAQMQINVHLRLKKEEKKTRRRHFD